MVHLVNMKEDKRYEEALEEARKEAIERTKEELEEYEDKKEV